MDVFGLECRDDVVVVTPRGDLGEFGFEIVHTAADAAVLEFERVTDKRHVVIDFQNTDYFGSSAMGFFIQLWRRVRARDGNMVFCNLSDHEKELLQITRLDSLWSSCDTLEQALAIARQDAVA